MNKKKNKIGYLLYGAAISVLIGGFVIFALEKQQVTDFYDKPTYITTEARPVNDILYTPATPADNDSINEQKVSGATEEPPTTPEPGAPISIVLTAAGQDSPGGPVVVKVLLTDTQTGTCTISLTKNDVAKVYTGAVTNAGTYYNCDTADIPLSDLSAGTWELTVAIDGNGRTGSVKRTVEVSL